MIPVRIFYRFSLITSLIFTFQYSHAQFVTKVLDYLPAPGQYTNADNIGTPEAANSLSGTNKGLVSLGDFGGSVTVYFSSAIKNDPVNPYGVDFTVYGNATATWSEPGIIQVMKDENQNGLPDDSWYEIAGSDHFWDSSISNYEITYQNNGLSKAGDIHWSDNQGATGIIPESSFHQQPYFPKAEYFPQLNTDNYSLSGTLITGQIDLSNPGVVNSYRRAFGYADNTPVLSATEKLPDNPYSAEIEGSGGDAIDIDWATDKNGKQVHLDEISFIRIYTGMNALAGWLGGISTEITGIRDVEPAEVSGVSSRIVIQDLPPKVRIGEDLKLNALVFEKGIKQQSIPISWTVSNPELAILENGHLLLKKTGTFNLRASMAANSSVFAEKEFEVFSAGKAEITMEQTNLKVNDKLELTGILTDQNGAVLTGITPVWRIGNTSIAEVVSQDGKYFLTGKQTGKSWLYLEAAEIKSVRDSVQIEVFPESARKKVFISVKTTENTIIPRHSVWVEQVDLTANVDRNIKNYGLQEVPFVSLAHAIAAAFNESELTSGWAFRDDAEGGSKLYLYKVPEIQDGSTLYNIGYGGSRSSEAYRKTWVVMLNQQPYVSGFEQIRVNNDDEILVYHITDNNIPWEVTHLTSGSDSVNTNQTVEIQLKKYSCSLDDNRNVAVNSSDIMMDQLVQVELNDPENSLKSLTTDEFGKALFTVNVPGKYLIHSGIDASVMIAESVTGIKSGQNKQLNCSVYPNPFSESIQLECAHPIESIRILNTLGQTVLNLNDPLSKIDLTFLSKGFYIIIVQSGDLVFQQKIVKN